jgi:hypothetical protein
MAWDFHTADNSYPPEVIIYEVETGRTIWSTPIVPGFTHLAEQQALDMLAHIRQHEAMHEILAIYASHPIM